MSAGLSMSDGGGEATPLGEGACVSEGTEKRLESACREVLSCLGEDLGREGLRSTPLRMARALLELTAGGRGGDAVSLLQSALFSSDSEGMVVVQDIFFSSLCEHHVLPFLGKCHVAYFPNGQIVGLSKLARAVDLLASKLQVQERLTDEVAKAVQEATGAKGVAVLIQAEHLCMTARGVQKPGAKTTTTTYTGCFRENDALRTEFQTHIQ